MTTYLNGVPVPVAPADHAVSHEDTGSDEIGVAALSGLLGDDQHVLDAEVLAVAAALLHSSRHIPGGTDPMRWTADKLLKGAGAGADPAEIDPPVIENVWNSLTVLGFQLNPATGTFSSHPEQINDNNVVQRAESNAVGQYCEINLNALLYLTQYRYYGHIGHAGDGKWKIQRLDINDNTWVDWITEISTRTTANWSDWISGSTIKTGKIRIVNTFSDTMNGISYMPEVEMKY